LACPELMPIGTGFARRCIMITMAGELITNPPIKR
jgi:hypothetical protein